MIIFGVILLVLALLVIAYMWLATAGMEPIPITYGVLNLDISPVWLFFLGGITLAAATCALWLLGVGAKSQRRRSKEVRELRRQAAAKDANRRAARTGDAANVDRPSATGTAGTGTGATGTSQASSRTGDQGPILPRPGRDDARGTRDSSQLDLDR